MGLTQDDDDSKDADSKGKDKEGKGKKERKARAIGYWLCLTCRQHNMCHDDVPLVLWDE